MHGEFEEISSSLPMLSSSDQLLGSDQEELTKLELQPTPKFEFPDGSRNQELEEKDVKEEERSPSHAAEESQISTASSPAEDGVAEEIKAVDQEEEEEEEDDDGYHTPTSPSRRIPPPLHCPPAPMKPRPQPRKRKAGSRKFYHVIPHIDPSSGEVELILCLIADDRSNRNIKKARGEFE